MLSTEKINQITVEELTGKPCAEPDDDEAALFRAKLRTELDDMEDDKIVVIPNE